MNIQQKVQTRSLRPLGNNLRSMFMLTNNGPVIYGPTESQANEKRREYANIFNQFPTLREYPWLTPIEQNIPASLTFKVLGKGVGEIEWYNAGTQSVGVDDFSYDGNKFYQVIAGIDIPAPMNVNETCVYPFSGTIYSGTVVQFINEINEDNLPIVSVVPYQAGRGIPENNKLSPYFCGNPYGQLTAQDTEIASCLSMGVIPGNNIFPVGVVIDSETQSIYSSYSRTGAHCAPMTKDFHIPSPEGYSNKEPIPVLTKGNVNCIIGACYNVGMQAYYEPNVEDDPIENEIKYVSVPCIPLFEGESVDIGTYVYASVMGNVIRPESVGLSPYPPATLYDCQQVFHPPEDIGRRDSRYENPWHDWYDITYGSVGWTGTPQVILPFVPNQGFDLIESKNGVALPYLNQANQGTVIVQARTENVSLSGRALLLGPAEYDAQGVIMKFPSAPERAQPIGVIMEKIEGTGRWIYDGTTGIEQIIADGGSGLTTTRSVEFFNETVNNLTVDITTNDAGEITGVSVNTLLTIDNYPRGTLLNVLQSPAGILRNDGYIYVSDNDGATLTLVIISPGSGYSSDTGVKTQNIQKQNPTVDIVCDENEVVVNSILRSVGVGNSNGDTVSYQNAVLTLVMNGGVFASWKGGEGYEYVYSDTEYASLYNGSTIITDAEMPLFNTESLNLYYFIGNTYSQLETFYIVTTGTTIEANTDDVLTVVQNTHSSIFDTGPGGAVPAGLYWPSVIENRTATYKIIAENVEIANGGTGYIPGHVTTDGDFDVCVNIVDPTTKAVTSINTTAPTKTPLDLGAEYTLNSGDYNATVRLTPAIQNLQSFLTIGGTGYANGTGVATRNLCENLFVMAKPLAGSLTVYDYSNSATPALPTSPFIGLVYADLSRYQVGDQLSVIEGTNETAIIEVASVNVATSEISFALISGGNDYSALSDTYGFYSTRRISGTPTVLDVTADSGVVKYTQVGTLGDRLRYGDLLVIEDGDYNCVIQYTLSLNIPPRWIPEKMMRPATVEEWNVFNATLRSAKNLLGTQILIDFHVSYPNYYNNSWYWYGDGGFDGDTSLNITKFL